MTTKEKIPMIGQRATIKLNQFHIDVTIIDIKTSWGKTRYLVRPVFGYGDSWVENINTNSLIHS